MDCVTISIFEVIRMRMDRGDQPPHLAQEISRMISCYMTRKAEALCIPRYPSGVRGTGLLEGVRAEWMQLCNTTCEKVPSQTRDMFSHTS